MARLTYTSDVYHNTSGPGSFNPDLLQTGGYNSAWDDQKHGIGVRVDLGESSPTHTRAF